MEAEMATAEAAVQEIMKAIESSGAGASFRHTWHILVSKYEVRMSRIILRWET